MRRIILTFLRNIGIILFSAIFIVILLIGFFQDRFIFQPVRLDSAYTFSFSSDFTEHFIPTADGEKVNALLFHPHDSTRGLLVYFHGNAGNLTRWGEIAGKLSAHGYHVLVIDYRGYGKSTGRPSEKGLYADAKAAIQWASQNIPIPLRVIYGRSLGTAVAANAARVYQPDLLILETPFDELKGAVRPSLKPFLKIVPLKYSFPTAQYLAGLTCPVLIGHGTEDEIVSPESALRLKSVLKPTDVFILVEGGDHNNLKDFTEWREAVASRLQSLSFVKAKATP
ncbi:MAG: alpha/beta hydrolase [Cyclobacteriaceae bacterium]|nr:alpha/beta hydrolase [Cyclobacteriaceae bacterium]MDW8331815.1 alpha/beta hydrolase [Cyclobacteriaceae bacterium]